MFHHPEFTMLEWYRAHGPYELLMDDCMAVIASAAKTSGARQFSFRDRTADPFAAPERITVTEAFERFAGIDLMAALPMLEGPDRRRFAKMAIDAGVNIPHEDAPNKETWGDIFSRVLVEKIEPHLGPSACSAADCGGGTWTHGSAAASRSGPEVGQRGTGWVIGREDQLEVVASLFSGARERLTAVVLEGAAGIGETTVFRRSPSGC